MYLYLYSFLYVYLCVYLYVYSYLHKVVSACSNLKELQLRSPASNNVILASPARRTSRRPRGKKLCAAGEKARVGHVLASSIQHEARCM